MSTESKDFLSRQEKVEKQVFIVSSFEKLLEGVISNGRYQWRLIIIFLIPLSLLYGVSLLNYLLLMSTPKHHCYVPVENELNYTTEEWNNLTIPWEQGPDGQMHPSKCKMYNLSHEFQLEDENFVKDLAPSIDCKHGWSYDKTNWEETPVTKFDWVCDKKKYVTLIFTANLAGNAVGTLILPPISDRFGRKPLFYVALLINLIFGNAIIFAPSFSYFIALKFLGATAFFTLYQLAYIIVVELCNQKLRSIATFATWFMFGMSSGILSLEAWLIREWKTYLLVTQLPLAIFIFYFRFIPESPRWLLSRGKLVECEKVLTKIAVTNGVQFTEEMRQLINQAHEEGKKKVPPTKIFTSFVLVKHLMLVSTIKGLGGLCGLTLNLNIHNMKGNIFLNYFLLRSFEFPGLLLSTISASYLGRRLNVVLCFIMAAVAVTVASFLVTETWSLLIVIGIAKIFFRAEIYSLFIHTGELFPTPLRATAYGIVGIAGITIAVMSPSLAALGSVNVRLPYYIIIAICFTAAILATFLPETLGYSLPQTLKEAKQIGKDQSYFTLLPKRNAQENSNKERNPRNVLLEEKTKKSLLNT